jgi:hypothetical protein
MTSGVRQRKRESEGEALQMQLKCQAMRLRVACWRGDSGGGEGRKLQEWGSEGGDLPELSRHGVSELQARFGSFRGPL